MFVCFCFSRGDAFRREFSKLGEVRSLIPSHVNVMALTATASLTTQQKIFKVLGMKDPVIVSEFPNRPNITYWISEKKSVEEVFSPIVHHLLRKQKTMGKIIIFCCSYDECVSLYRFFLRSLGKKFTYPVGAPNLSQYRLVDMYANPTKADVKDTIVTSFCNVGSTLRVVICTVAFGMGTRCSANCTLGSFSRSGDVHAREWTSWKRREVFLCCAFYQL